MANQRRADKANFSGYCDKALKPLVRSTGLDEAGFIEWAIVRTLHEMGKLGPSVIEKMLNDSRLRATTGLLWHYEVRRKTKHEHGT